MKHQLDLTKLTRHAVPAFLIVLLAAPLLAVGGPASGQEETPAPETKPSQPRFRLGAYLEGWQLNDKNLTSFFGHSQKNLGGIEASIHTKFNVDVWVSYRKYADETMTPVYENIDKFEMTATSLGLIYRPIVWKMLEPFVGAGAEFYSYEETIVGETQLRPTTGSASGLHAQFGVYINATKFLSGKIFVRLNSVKDKLEQALPDGPSELDLGGKEFGIGLTFRF